MYNNIKTSNTGIHTDVYKPKCKNLFEYDVNSLYPYVMKMFNMPIGQPKYFGTEGDIFKYFPNARRLGFFNFKINFTLAPLPGTGGTGSIRYVQTITSDQR